MQNLLPLHILALTWGVALVSIHSKIKVGFVIPSNIVAVLVLRVLYVNGRYSLLAYSCYLRVTSVCGRIRLA